MHCVQYILYRLYVHKSLEIIYANGTDRVYDKVSHNLEDETTDVVVLDLEHVESGRVLVLSVELDVNNGADDGLDLPIVFSDPVV